MQALALVEALSEQPKPAPESTPAPRLSRAELVKLARQQDPDVKIAWEQPETLTPRHYELHEAED